MPRATFFNDASHKASTRSEYERIGRRYCVAAHKSTNDDLEPDVEWLAGYLAEIRAKGGKSLALRHARAIGHHMRVNGKENLCDRLEVERVLFAPDPWDPVYREIPALGDDRLRKRAQYFMDSAYDAETLRAYHREIVKCAEAHDFTDPAEIERLGEEGVFIYLHGISERNSGHHVRNVRNALSHFFRVRRLTDVTRTERIDDLVRSVKGNGARPPPKPYEQEERAEMLSALGDSPLDVRDHVMAIIVSFSRYCPETVVSITVERCHPEGDGWVIQSEDPERFDDTFIGGCDDPNLDIRIWLPRLIELVKSGPLFQTLNRGRFNGRAASHGTAWGALRRIGALYGHPDDAVRRLKLTFRETVLAKRGPIALCRHLGLKRIPRAQLRLSERTRAMHLTALRRKPKFKRLTRDDFRFASCFRRKAS